MEERVNWRQDQWSPDRDSKSLAKVAVAAHRIEHSEIIDPLYSEKARENS